MTDRIPLEHAVHNQGDFCQKAFTNSHIAARLPAISPPAAAAPVNAPQAAAPTPAASPSTTK